MPEPPRDKIIVMPKVPTRVLWRAARDLNGKKFPERLRVIDAELRLRKAA